MLHRKEWYVNNTANNLYSKKTKYENIWTFRYRLYTAYHEYYNKCRHNYYDNTSYAYVAIKWTHAISYILNEQGYFNWNRTASSIA